MPLMSSAITFSVMVLGLMSFKTKIVPSRKMTLKKSWRMPARPHC